MACPYAACGQTPVSRDRRPLAIRGSIRTPYPVSRIPGSGRDQHGSRPSRAPGLRFGYASARRPGSPGPSSGGSCKAIQVHRIQQCKAWGLPCLNRDAAVGRLGNWQLQHLWIGLGRHGGLLSCVPGPNLDQHRSRPSEPLGSGLGRCACYPHLRLWPTSGSSWTAIQGHGIQPHKARGLLCLEPGCWCWALRAPVVPQSAVWSRAVLAHAVLCPEGPVSIGMGANCPEPLGSGLGDACGSRTWVRGRPRTAVQGPSCPGGLASVTQGPDGDTRELVRRSARV